MLGVGFYFMRSNKTVDDYYVGGRKMSSWHIGLSVVATDVGGGFSIGLGGLGFAIGLAGSWMLFTGLIGAWLSAILLIPRVFKLLGKYRLFTFPEIFKYLFNTRVALVAGIVSAVGYMGFTSAQILAGAKLAVATFPSLDLLQAIMIMGITAVVYTVFGGLKAVIYTDTVQWILLMVGLIFIGIPLGYQAVGGWEGISSTIEPSFLDPFNISWQQLLNWAITIIPIWFIGMTLYQRIYASRDEKTARKAWLIAGLFEWPTMAFMGVLLGLFARVALQQGMFESIGYATLASMDSEMGLPVMLRTVLPVGLMGLMMSAYFSAIMSTADSCLMAASGNVVTDIMARFLPLKEERLLKYSQLVTFAIGALSLLLATAMTNVLDLMLMSYSFMVSGLLVPLLAALFFKNKNADAALAAMLSGGATTLLLEIAGKSGWLEMPLGLDANIFGISLSLVVYLLVSKLTTQRMDFTIINASTGEHPEYTNEAVADFLYQHLEQYGDEKEDILKCLAYVYERGGFITVGTDNGDIKGIVVINDTHMDGYIPEHILVYIAVDGKTRGKGYGKKLMQKVIDETRGDIALHVEPDNPARHLYEKLGFTNKYLEMRLKK